jgi:ubiquilin
VGEEHRGSGKRFFYLFFAVFSKGSLAMGEEAEGGVDASGGSVTVHVRCSNGNKFSLAVDLASTVRDLKMMLVERSEIPADQQRLIYKGRVLKDESSLDSYGAYFFLVLVLLAPSRRCLWSFYFAIVILFFMAVASPVGISDTLRFSGGERRMCQLCFMRFGSRCGYIDGRIDVCHCCFCLPWSRILAPFSSHKVWFRD